MAMGHGRERYQGRCRVFWAMGELQDIERLQGAGRMALAIGKGGNPKIYKYIPNVCKFVVVWGDWSYKYVGLVTLSHIQ